MISAQSVALNSVDSMSRQPRGALGCRKRRFRHRTWRRLIRRAWATCRVAIRPAQAAFTK